VVNKEECSIMIDCCVRTHRHLEFSSEAHTHRHHVIMQPGSDFSPTGIHYVSCPWSFFWNCSLLVVNKEECSIMIDCCVRTHWHLEFSSKAHTHTPPPRDHAAWLILFANRHSLRVLSMEDFLELLTSGQQRRVFDHDWLLCTKALSSRVLFPGTHTHRHHHMIMQLAQTFRQPDFITC